MENVLHARMPGHAIYDPSGWTYYTVCGTWVQTYDLAWIWRHVTCPECKADLQDQTPEEQRRALLERIPSQAHLWVDPP
jgi:hypothetical protein